MIGFGKLYDLRYYCNMTYTANGVPLKYLKDSVYNFFVGFFTRRDSERKPSQFEATMHVQTPSQFKSAYTPF